MSTLTAKVNSFCYAAEKRAGLYGASFFFALLSMAIACLSTTSRWEVHFHGTAFSQLSINPFDLSQENALRFRILSPILGYLFFMRGPQLYLYFILFVTVLFIAGVYVRYRKKNYSGTESLGMASLMAFSSIAYYILFFPAYSDPTSYLLILLCMSFYDKKGIMTWLLILLVFNHESNLFVFPWLFYIMNSKNGRFHLAWKKDLKYILPFATSMLLYVAYRIYITEHSPVQFTLSYYFNMHNIEWTFNAIWKKLPVGIFMAFKLFWLFPILAVLHFRKKSVLGGGHELMGFFLLFFGVLSQLIIAYDLSRLICLAFPLILLGAETTRNAWGTMLFNKRLWIIITLNFLVPTYLIGALEPTYMKPLIVELIQNWIGR